MPAGHLKQVLECVVNVSEGRDPSVLHDLAAAGGSLLLDVHSDPDHHRSVLTLCGPAPDLEAAVRAVAAATLARLDIRDHAGVHPRIGVLDVVPFVALAPGREGDLARAIEARDRFATWAGHALQLPCFLYGPERTLPEVRRQAWGALLPDRGPSRPHPTAGAAAVGARPVLVAYNLWLSAGVDLAVARAVAATLRRPGLRTLGLPVAGSVQVSCNLVEPWRLGPGAVYDLVALELERIAPGAGIERAELVGLLPGAVLAAERPERCAELGLGPDRTIEARLEQAGLDGGSV